MRLTTGKGAAAASRGTTGGATGMTPTCGAGGASTIGSSIGSSSRGTTSAVCSRSISSVTSILRSASFDDIRPRVAFLSDHGCWHPHMIEAHANFLARLKLRQLSRSSVEYGLVSSLSLL